MILDLKAVAIMIAVVAALTTNSTLIAVPAHAAGEFTCKDGFPYKHAEDKAELDRLGHNGAMTNIIKEYIQRWDSEQIRLACDAKIAGRDYDYSCFGGRRDWAAIEAMIPFEYFKMDSKALRSHQLRLQSEIVNPRGDAFDYCRSIGAM